MKWSQLEAGMESVLLGWIMKAGVSESGNKTTVSSINANWDQYCKWNKL